MSNNLERMFEQVAMNGAIRAIEAQAARLRNAAASMTTTVPNKAGDPVIVRTPEAVMLSRSADDMDQASARVRAMRG